MGKIYLASDFHLGVPDHAQSLERERKLVRWLETIRNDAEEIYLVGDLFDFWFEYKTVIPKYFTRFLGKLAELSDSGIRIYIFSGNHDVWMKDYFMEEMGITVYHEPIERNWDGKNIYIAHGDGLGPGDYGYKFIKKLFRNPFCQWLYRWLHPDLGVRLARFFSHTSRNANGESDVKFLGEDKEWLIIHSKELYKIGKKFNYYIYGHRHLPMMLNIENEAQCVNLGDWITHFTYAVFSNGELELKSFEQQF